MPLPPALRRTLFGALTGPRVNRYVVRPLRHVPPLRRWRGLARVPVVGTFEVAGFGGCRIAMQSDGRDSIASRLFWCGLESFEPETLGPFSRLARQSRTILDIGANSGLYTLVAATANPQATVVAFEPVPQIHRYLRANVALNGSVNVRTEQLALSDRVGHLDFFVPAAITLPMSSSARAGFRAAETTLRVPTTTLDAFADEAALDHIDLVKIDTEATEPDVLAGGAATMARHRPVVVCEVLRGRTEEALQARLEPTGYVYFQLTPAGLEHRHELVGDSVTNRNFLFVPPEKVAWVAQHAGVAMRGSPAP